MTDAADAPAPPTRRSWPAAALCVVLAIVFAFHSWRAASTKSPTFDEPVYALSAWLSVNRGDFRLNPEHPALWKYLPGLPLIGFPLNVDLDGPAGRHLLKGVVESQWPFMVDTLFRTPGNDGVALVARSRVAMSVIPFLLALVVARWAWLIGGSRAAVLALVPLTLDPNLLAHGALVVNDVFATFLFALVGLLTWRLGRRFAWPTAAALCVTCAAGVGVKASLALLVPMVGGPLLLRAIAPRWLGDGDANTTRARAVGRVALLAVATSVIAYASLWPMYRFRTAPTPAGDRFDPTPARWFARYQDVITPSIRAGQPIDEATARAAAEARPLAAPAAALAWLEDRRLLPQSFSLGLLYVQAKAAVRPTYLLGENSNVGWYSYFPLAFAFKTPLATLAMASLALVVIGPMAWRAARRDPAWRWTLLCLALPPAIFLAAAMSANLNIGIRHVLPVLPPLYVAIGVCASRAIDRWRRAAMTTVGVLAVALAAEVLAVFPNYIAFFNVAAGGPRGGLAKLGDSNLDWGQDLPALADWYRLWRRANPTEPFYLAYFGSVDPHFYGIDYVNAWPGFPLDRAKPTDEYLRRGGLLAISATALQGLIDEQTQPTMAVLRTVEPLDVINGSIYIYRLPPSGAEASR